MHFQPLLLSLGLAALTTAAPVDCTIAIECSNGITYIGCKAVQECEAAGGHFKRNTPAVSEPRDCALAIECSNGITYTGCQAVSECEAAGGYPVKKRDVPPPAVAEVTKRSAAPQLTCELIVFCSNGITYKGCDAVQECEAAGGVPGGAPGASS